MKEQEGKIEFEMRIENVLSYFWLFLAIANSRYSTVQDINKYDTFLPVFT